MNIVIDFTGRDNNACLASGVHISIPNEMVVDEVVSLLKEKFNEAVNTYLVAEIMGDAIYWETRENG